jgi:DnaJ-domain-containing protein 1
VSITKRLLDVARSNLTDFRDAFSSDRLRELLRSDKEDPEVEKEVEETIGKKAGRRAREFKDAAEEAWERAYENARNRAGVRGEPSADPAADRRRWYNALQVPQGSDLATVRKAYRKLTLQYHPDRFANDPDKQKAATEVTRKLNEAYNGLRRYLGE